MDAPIVSGSLVPDSYARQHAARWAACDPSRAARGRTASAVARWWRATTARHGPASSPRGLHESATVPLLRLLGYSLVEASLRTGRDHVAAVVRGRGRCAPLAVFTTAWNVTPQLRWRSAVETATRAGAAWCLVCNGATLAVVDAARPYSRRDVCLDLPRTVAAGAVDVLLWLFRADAFTTPLHRSRFEQIVADAARHQALTCAAVDRGVRAAHDRLQTALASHARESPRRSPDAVTRGAASASIAAQSLTVVFRLLFLLYAEARLLVPLDHPIYREGYSLSALVEALPRASARGWWAAVRAIMRMAHAGCRARDLNVTAFNGRLFAPSQAPLAERAAVSDESVRAALTSLAVREDRHGRRHVVPYGELGVEQLGAIYERLIDAPPAGARAVAAASLRKATGTFYTPGALTRFVVRRTLGPLVDGATPDQILALRVVDPAMGSGAFLVAACHHLAAAYERALVDAGGARPGDVDEAARAGFRRLVAQRCLYGVDANPMAVQLARLSMWLTTLARDRPLTFLDHRLRVGDSLVGASPDDLARQAAGPSRVRQSDPLPLLAWLDAIPSLSGTVRARQVLARTPDTDAATVRGKEAALERLEGASGPLAAWRAAADVWCAAWFWPDAPPGRPVFRDLIASALGGDGALPPAQREALLDTARAVAARRPFFHWELEFPEVFTDEGGHPRDDRGFDAVIGNPPWDVLRAEDGVSRAECAQQVAFVRSAGLYTRGRDAHVNRYQLFVERALALTRHGGRIGLIVPWGLFGDAGSAAARRRLLERASLETIVSFDNRRAVFPIHRSVRFAVLAATNAGPTHAVACRAGETSVEGLERIPDAGAMDAFPLVFTRDALADVSGETLAFPWARSRGDLALLRTLRARWPSLSEPAGWGASFGRELNASDDRAHFRPHGPGYPIVEGKHLSPFVVEASSASTYLPHSAATPARRRRFGAPRVAFRDVASAGNRLTLIAAVLPGGVATTHTVFTLKGDHEEASQHVLCALLNSLVANWWVRHWVSTHVTTAIVERLPVPVLRPGERRFEALLRLARRCAIEGTEGHAWIDLQVEAARAYAVTTGPDLSRILDTFPLIAAERRAAVLQGASGDEPGL